MIGKLKWNTQGLWLLLLSTVLCVLSCKENKRTEDTTSDPEKLEIRYAKGFEVEYYNGYKLLKVINPWKGSEQQFTYILSGGIEADSVPVSYDAFVKLPVKSMVCTSTSHLPMLEMLGREAILTGFPNTALITSNSFIKKAESGELTDIGTETGLNIEKLIELDPQLVINYATGNEFDQLDVLERSGIPYILNADYMENTPLGRAEWIKFFAIFFNREKLADSIFREIEADYLNLKERTEHASQKPTVLTGIMYGDTWFLPGGDNYAARFFEDSGADYLWAESEESGWLELGYESVYEKASNADYWLGCGSFNTLKEMQSADERYSVFESFQNGSVYNYNARMGKNGGNAYLELGYARPDIILSDLIHILHPELLSGNELFFYKKLE